MTRHSDICFVNVNGVIVDNGSERILAIRIEEKGSTANLNGTGLHEHIKEIPVYLLLLRNLRRRLRILNLLNRAAIRDDGSELRVSTPTFLLLRINRFTKGERWPSIPGRGTVRGGRGRHRRGIARRMSNRQGRTSNRGLGKSSRRRDRNYRRRGECPAGA